MAREQFGVTWWGQEWLRSLDHIDYENRIPRGKSYARNGMVRKVTIKDNVITASVSGSRRTPYKVMIVVPPFFDEDVDRLVNALMQRPAIIGKLLNRELDKEVLSIAESCGLKVFPRQWSDIKLQCSCPDWAVPCKHLAAVIYMVSREIDNNPFLVFEMHRVDLIEELRKRGLTMDVGKSLDVQDYTSTIEVLPSAKKRKKDELAPQDSNRVPEAASPIDFSRLEDIGDLLVKMLNASPAFCGHGDFREDYAISLRAIAREMSRIFDSKTTLDSHLDIHHQHAITRHTNVDLLLDDRMECDVVLDEGIDEIPQRHVTLPSLLLSLQALDPDLLPDYQPSVQAVHATMMCALHLLQHGAIYPSITKLSKTEYAIAWNAATFDSRVKAVTDAVQNLSHAVNASIQRSNRKHPLPLANTGIVILSLMLRTLIAELSRKRISVAEPLSRLFFGGEIMDFSAVGEHNTPGGIKSWLEPYSIGTDQSISPVLVVSELAPGEFELRIDIKHSLDDGSTRLATLQEVGLDERWSDKRMEIYKRLSMLARLMGEGLDSYINNNGSESLRFDLKSIVPFLFEAIPVIKLLGITVMLPNALENIIRPKVSGHVGAMGDGSDPGYFNVQMLFSFDWRIAIGDKMLSTEEFKRLIEDASGLIEYKGQYFYADSSDIERLLKELEGTKPLNGTQAFQAALSGMYGDVPVDISADAQAIIDTLRNPIEVKLPRGIKANLRPYQKRGYEWMYRNRKLGLGSIIADDMGLGKTLQVITLITKLKEEGQLKKEKVLIVVPTGLISNWEQEFDRFAPRVTHHVHHGTDRNIKKFDADVLITTYGVMRSDVKELSKMKWGLMVIDEAQNIKNSTTLQTKAVNAIKAGTRIAMSGTPVENRLSEFWSIMDYVNKGLLGTRKQFEKEYAKPIQLYGDAKLANKFRSVTSPFLMRRLKTDKSIINDLPDKIEQNDYSRLTPVQAGLYESTLREGMSAIESITGDSAQQLFKRQGLVLQMMLALKQICNHPAQFLKDDNRDAALSGKCQMLLDLVDSIIASGEKALIFTQFTQMGEILQELLSRHTGTTPLFYHGGCTIKQRNAIVNRFQNNRADQLLILSLKAAGTGLNLTAASHVIHFDLWWNPAVEAQATDRAYRIGQHKNVLVHRFITKDTFEERIDDMIQKKKGLAQMTVATGENWIGKLNNDEIREIFQR